MRISHCSFSDSRQILGPVKHADSPASKSAPSHETHTIDSQDVEPTIVLSRSRSLWLFLIAPEHPPSPLPRNLSLRGRGGAHFLVGRCQCGLHCSLGLALDRQVSWGETRFPGCCMERHGRWILFCSFQSSTRVDSCGSRRVDQLRRCRRIVDVRSWCFLNFALYEPSFCFANNSTLFFFNLLRLFFFPSCSWYPFAAFNTGPSRHLLGLG